MKTQSCVVALAGQPNSGKSTVFNMLTGAHQHVANYPGVTVEKKTGQFRTDELDIELVDLPGTYSLTSYSLEERVARNFLLHEKPEVCVNVADVSTLRRSLSLTFQLMEMDCPVVLALNMMDKARKEGVELDLALLENRLGVRVVPVAAARGEGRRELVRAVADQARERPRPRQIDYGPLEEKIQALETWMVTAKVPGPVPPRWLALKLLEGDEFALDHARTAIPEGEVLVRLAEGLAQGFVAAHGASVAHYLAVRRHVLADEILASCQKRAFSARNLTNRIDAVVCHKVAGPVVLVGIIYLLYQLSIVQGYNLTNYTWPLLAKLKEWCGLILPSAGFVDDPLIRALGLWVVDSVNALLNYIPIFLILFSLIAILEDSGYMPRMAFILDRMLQRFGLHGQATLPLVLGGVYVGGCAVPAVMSTKAVPDHRARLATILIIPMLNCLAKVPLYILLVSAYFAEHQALAMFFISTISLLLALPVAKLLTLTVLRKQESAPFIMEMPDYHLPTLGGVLRPALQKVWLFVKKITSIVAAVAVIVFALLRFPGVGEDAMRGFEARADKAMDAFMATVDASPLAGRFQRTEIPALLEFEDAYKQAKIGAKSEEGAARIDARFAERNAVYLAMVKGQPVPEHGKIGRGLRALTRERKLIRMDVQKERIDASFLGRIGQAMEPVTRWAGFTWRINVALLSALAAKENTVATLGSLYQQDADAGGDLAASMQETETGFTALHALALMLFMVLYPPCLATLITIKLETGSWGYMLFSLGGQIALGIVVSVLVFTGGSLLGLSGLEAMIAFYLLAVALAIGAALIPNPPLEPDSGRS
ncbi:MAG: ferrous iron transport protein B [Deltaproteobacteria bacterium]|nr:ferrous iron transport protein B [Deltaproteobacteria bacterium]